MLHNDAIPELSIRFVREILSFTIVNFLNKAIFAGRRVYIRGSGSLRDVRFNDIHSTRRVLFFAYEHDIDTAKLCRCQ